MHSHGHQAHLHTPPHLCTAKIEIEVKKQEEREPGQQAVPRAAPSCSAVGAGSAPHSRPAPAPRSPSGQSQPGGHRSCTPEPPGGGIPPHLPCPAGHRGHAAAVLLASLPGTATTSGAPGSATPRPLRHTGDGARQNGHIAPCKGKGRPFGGCVEPGTPAAGEPRARGRCGLNEVARRDREAEGLQHRGGAGGGEALGEDGNMEM